MVFLGLITHRYRLLLIVIAFSAVLYARLALTSPTKNIVSR